MKLQILLLGLLLWSCQSKEIAPSKNKSSPVQKQKPAPKSMDNEIRAGDLIFQTSLSNQSRAIQIATDSKYSHMGIIYKEEGEFYVYEAIQPVQLTPLEKWIARGENNSYLVKRVAKEDRIRTKEGLKKMKLIGKKYLDKDYDLRFEWSDDKIYCSELVWKIYKEAFDIEIGSLQRIRDFDLSDPLVQAKLKERYGDKIPMDELVITPERMFRAENLITIKSN